MKFQQTIVGMDLVVTGKVDDYYGQLEVILLNSKDIVLSNNISSITKVDVDEEEAIETTQPINFITKDDIDQEVVIEGKIISKYDHPDGHLFLTLLTESNQEMTVPLFSSLSPNSGDYKINSKIQVKGTVNLYKEKLQVIPDNLDEVAVVSVGGKKKDRIILPDRIVALEEVHDVLQAENIKDWNY